MLILKKIMHCLVFNIYVPTVRKNISYSTGKGHLLLTLIRKSKVSTVPGARNGRKLVPLPPLFSFFYQETFQGKYFFIFFMMSFLFFHFLNDFSFDINLMLQTWKSSIHFLSSSFLDMSQLNAGRQNYEMV